MVDIAALASWTRVELVEKARQLGVERPERMTRLELRDEIQRLTGPRGAQEEPRGLLGAARTMLAGMVEAGLNMPEAAAVIRGEAGFDMRVKNQPPVATVTLAEIYAAQGHRKRALRMLDDVLAAEPDHEVARELRQKLAAEGEPKSPDTRDAKDPQSALVETTGEEIRTGKPPEVAPVAPPEPEAQPRDQDRPQDDQDRLQADQDRLQDDQDRLQGDQDRLQDDQDRLQGDQDDSPDDQDDSPGDQDDSPGDQDRLQGGQDRLQGGQDRLQGDQDDSQDDQDDSQDDQDDSQDDQDDSPGDQDDSPDDQGALEESSTSAEVDLLATDVPAAAVEAAVDPDLGVPGQASAPDDAAPDDAAPDDAAPDDALFFRTDPEGTQLYWELSSASVDRARRRMPEGHAVLRVVGMQPSAEGTARVDVDLFVETPTGLTRLQELRPPTIVRAALGWLAPEGFTPLAVAAELDGGYRPPTSLDTGAAELRARERFG